MPEILKSKLLPPYTGTGLIERPRLIKLLFKNEKQKATILSAPAGYGKTVSMVQLIGEFRKPVVWYQLDEHDNDPAVFLAYFIAGLRHHYPGFGKDVLQITAQEGLAARQRLVVTAVVNDLEDKVKDGLVIAFDDYHLLEEASIHGFVQELLKHLPAGVHMLIASRTPLPVSLTRLKMQGNVFVAGPEDLRFTREEMREFLIGNGQEASDGNLEALEQKTAGWPAALRLMIDSAATMNEFAAVDGDRAEIYDFLATEVLDSLPENVHSFLLGSSVLEELDPGFCDALLERSDAAEILAYLEKQRLFLIPLGREKTYRYHHLFRDFLRTRLGAPERAALLKRAGALARQAGRSDIAVEYLAAAGCHEELPAILKEAGGEAFRRGQWQTVARWLALLPEGALLANPWLALYSARVAVRQGRLDEAEEWTRKAEGMFAEGRDSAGQVETLVLQAHFLVGKGRLIESLALLEQAEALLPPNEAASRIDILQEKIPCMFMLGRVDELAKLLAAALESTKGMNDSTIAASLTDYQGLVYYMAGRYPEALQCYRLAAEVSPDRNLPGLGNQDIVVSIYREWGELEKAFECARRNLALLENYGLMETLPLAYRQLGECYADQGEWHEAEEYLTRSIALSQDIKGDRTQLILSLMELAECYARQGRWVEARAKAEEALAATTPQTVLATACCRGRCPLIFLHTGDVRLAREMLTEMEIFFVRVTKYRKASAYIPIIQAAACFQAGETAAAAEYAGKGLAVAAGMNYQYIFLCWSDFLQPVLRYGIESGTEVTFVQRVLVKLGEKAIPLLTELAASPDANVRRKVAAPLAEIGGPQAAKALRALADDADGEVRQQARLAIRRLNCGGEEAAEVSVAAPATLQFATLGRFRVVPNGASAGETSWPTGKTRDLLAYLVHCEEAVSRDKILESLWPDNDLDSATGLFHTTIYYLRRIMGEIGRKDFIIYSAKRYKLADGGFVTDRQQFQALLAAGMRADLAATEAVAYLEQAMTIYGGDYLEELDYPWVIPVQENLRQSYVRARVQLAGYYLAASDYERALVHLQVAEVIEPFDEQVHVLLMTAFAGQGNRSAVKRQYLKMESDFRKELGLAPSPATRNLYLNLLK